MLEVLTSSTKEAPVKAYAGRRYVGIDLHRRRSVIVRTTATGEVLEKAQVLNDAERLGVVLARAGEHPQVVLEATYGWYWAVDALQGLPNELSVPPSRCTAAKTGHPPCPAPG
jgi:hypothetical protein